MRPSVIPPAVKLYTKAILEGLGRLHQPSEATGFRRRRGRRHEADAGPKARRFRVAVDCPALPPPAGGLEGLETARNGEARPQDVVVLPVSAIPTPNTHMLA